MTAANTSKRTFIPQDLDLSQWANLQPYYEGLVNEPVNSIEELKAWLHRCDELRDAVDEYMTRLFIGISTNTADEKAALAYNHGMGQLQPQIMVYTNKLNQKLTGSPYFEQLKEPDFVPAIRKIKSDMSIYSAANNDLLGQEEVLKNQFTQITGGQSFIYQSKQMPLDSRIMLWKNKDGAEREIVFKKYAEAVEKDIEKLDELFSKLIALRHQIAKNAGFANYNLYKFAEWGRFDYSIADAELMFHSIAEGVTPILKQLREKRRKTLQLDVLKPWDLFVPLNDRPELKPSENSEDLINKVIACFNRLNTSLGDGIARMKAMNHFDLEPRLNKMKGVAYNTPLAETGVPFILQNNNNSEHDVQNLTHEGGHALHSLLTANLEYSFFREAPLEMCEVASKAMELMSMEHWDIFYPNQDDLKQARKNKLEAIVPTLAMNALCEEFQLWVYEYPEHTVAERHKKWLELNDIYFGAAVDFSGYENIQSTIYQTVLPIYSLPLYQTAYCYSEFAAIALWRNFKKNPQKTLDQYKTTLTLGNKRTVPDLYKAAGVEFNSSAAYIKELMDFLQEQLAALD